MVGLGDPLPQLPGLLNISVRTDDGQTFVQHGHHGHQLGSDLTTKYTYLFNLNLQTSGYYLLARHVLDGWTFRQISPLSLAKVRPKVNRASPVINANLKKYKHRVRITPPHSLF